MNTHLAKPVAVAIARRLPQSSSDAGQSVSKPQVAAILSENEQLRNENAKLRQLKAHRSMDRDSLQAAEAELAATKRRNAELEERVGRRRGNPSNSNPVPPTVRPTTVPRSFSVRSWESERRIGDSKEDVDRSSQDVESSL